MECSIRKINKGTSHRRRNLVCIFLFRKLLCLFIYKLYTHFIISECREVDDSENRACEISLARLSPRLLRRRESKRHLFVVDSLDKQMQNEKEPIHLASAGGGGSIL